MALFNNTPMQPTVADLQELISSRVESIQSGKGIAAKPEKVSASKEDLVLGYFREVFNTTQEKADSVREELAPTMESLARESALLNAQEREAAGITQSLMEGGGEAYRSKTPEDTITRPVSRPDELVTDTAKDVEESAPVTVETEGDGIMSKPRPRAIPDDLNADLPTESGPTKVSADSPINVRNNNLGNIKNIKSNDWKGQTNLDSDETFASFSSPELGVRALKKVIQANINATNTIEEYVNRYASEPKEKAYYKKNGKLMPHLKNYATQIAKSQGLDSTTAAIPKDVDMLSWIKATAIAEGGADALTYFTDDVIKRGLAL